MCLQKSKVNHVSLLNTKEKENQLNALQKMHPVEKRNNSEKKSKSFF